MSKQKKPGRSWRFSLPSLSFRLPWLTKLSLPGPFTFRLPLPSSLYFGGGKFVLVSFSMVGVGFLAAMFLLVNTGDADAIYPDPGVYTAPSLIAREKAGPASQTRQINLPAGVRVNDILFENASLGKAGLETAVTIRGTSTAYILVNDLIIKNSEFPCLDFANSQFFTLNATSSVLAAGHTISETASTTLSDITVGSIRGAANYVARDKVVDRIIIRVSSTGTDVIINTMTFDGVKASVGGFDLDWVKAGTVTLENVRVGSDGDVNSADFIINSTVLITNTNENVVDSAIEIR